MISAWLVRAGLGRAWLGKAWQGLKLQRSGFGPDQWDFGRERHGPAGRGSARHGEARGQWPILKQETDMGDSVRKIGEGLSTGPDVEALKRAFPDIKDGDRISYAKVTAVIGLEWHDRRFKTVTNAWRRKLRELGLEMRCESKSAFVFLTNRGKLDETPVRIGRIQRQARDIRRVVSTVRPENDEMKREQLHHMTLANSIEQDAKKAKMNILPATEVKPQPRLQNLDGL